MQFFYLILSIYFGRRNPLYYLIFPIALVSGPGAFIDPRTVLFGNDIFLIGKNIYKDVIIFYLFLVAFHLRKQWSLSLLKRTPMMAYSLFIFFLIFLTLLTSGINYEAINVMRLFTNMVFGYFLLALIFSTANTRQFIAFFNSLFFTIGFLSICYVLNSAKILPVFYQENLFSEIDMGQESFFRDFSTIPIFSHLLFILAFSIILFKSKDFNHRSVLLVLATYPFVLLFTFTRSLLGATLVECMIIILVMALKRPRRIFTTRTIVLALSVLLIVGIVQIKFPNQLAYFSDRVDSAKNEGIEEGNVAIRIAYHAKAFEILNSKDALLFGDGINKKHELEMDEVGAWTADSTIPFLLIYTGVIGAVFYFLLRIYFLIKTISQLKDRFNPISLALFTTISFGIFSSLFMGGTRWGDPFIFFPFVLVVTVGNLIKKDPSFLTI